MSIEVASKNLGHATAYGYAKANGYTGTEQEYAELMASYGTVAQEAAASAEAAEAARDKAAEWATGGTSGTPGETNNAEYFSGQASGSATAASGSANNAARDALKAEGYAVGKQGGAAVSSDSPYYHANGEYYKEQAAGSATSAGQSAENAAADALKAEGFAQGKQGGTDVQEGSPYYHANGEYYKDQASSSASSASGSAANAAADALKSEGYATGKQNGTDVGSDSPYYHNSGAYYLEQTEAVAQSIPEDYTELSEDVSDLKSAITNVENSIGYLQITNDLLTRDGYRINTSGSAGSSTNYHMSQNINIPHEWKKVILTSSFVNDSSLYIDVGFYNTDPPSSTSFMSNDSHVAANITTPVTIPIPTGAKTMLLSCRKGYDLTGYVVSDIVDIVANNTSRISTAETAIDNVETEIEGLKYNYNNDASESLNTLIYKKSIQADDSTSVSLTTITGLYINESLKFTAIGQQKYCVDYCAVEKGKYYLLTATGYRLTGPYPGAVFTTDVPAAGDTAKYTIIEATTTETVINYLYYCEYDGYLCIAKNTDYVAISVRNVTTFEPINGTAGWSGKSACLMGDSIMAGSIGDNEYVDHPFGNYACDKLGITVLQNYAVPGSTLANSNSSAQTVLPNVDTNADVMIVSYGTNDWGHGIALGSYEDVMAAETAETTITANTFFGALWVTMDALMTKYAGKYIFFCTPLHRKTNQNEENSTTHLMLVAYRDAIIQMAEHFGIPVIDFYGMGLLNPKYNKTQNFVDLTHPNQNGHYKMAEILSAKMLELLH